MVEWFGDLARCVDVELLKHLDADPATGDLVDALRAAGVPAAVSGAGPTVLALPRNGGLPPGVDTIGFVTYRLDVDRVGATLRMI